MGEADWANTQLLDLWKTFPDRGKLTRRWPLLYNPLKTGCLLFVGLNPSWKKEWLEGAWKRVRLQNTEFPRSGIRDPTKLFEWGKSDPSQRKMQDIQDIDNVAVAREEDLYPYFKPMRKISQQIEMDDAWEHIDLFAVRERSYKSLVRILKIKNGRAESKFGEQQLEIALQLMEMLESEVVVVANAVASTILRARWDIAEPDKWREDATFRKNGYHEIEVNGSTVPVFFSSMLSGGALDRGSRERLAWHVWRALKQQ